MIDALGRLDPASRALLDLALRRGMRAEDIADVLGADVDTVVRMCDGALAEVAGGIGLEGQDVERTRSLLAELPSEQWPGGPVNGRNGASAAGEAARANGAGAETPEHESGAEAGLPGADGEAAPTAGQEGAEPEAGGAEIAEPEAGEAETAEVAEPEGADAETAETAEPEGADATAPEATQPEAAEPDEGSASHEGADAAALAAVAAADAATKASAEPDDPEHEAPGPAEAATAPDRAAAAAEAEADAGPAAETSTGDHERPPGDTEPAPRRRRAAGAVVLVAAVAAAVAVPLATSGGGHKSASSQSPAPQPPPPAHTASSPPRQPAAPPRPLNVVSAAATGAHATAQLTGGGQQLAIQVSGLSAPGNGFYEVWLFNSVIDSVPLARFGGGSGRVEVPLPPGARRFRLVDVSLQPAGGGAVHSGVSVLRVPLAQLER